MSVWDNPCFRIEPFVKTLQNYGGAARKTKAEDFKNELDVVIDDLGCFDKLSCERSEAELTTGRKSCSFYDLCSSKKRVWLQTRNSNALRAGSKGDRTFIELREHFKPSFYGLHAVYWAYSLLESTKGTIKPEFEAAELSAYVEDVWSLSAAPSRINREQWDKIRHGYKSTLSEDADYVKERNLAEAIGHFWNVRYTRSWQRLRSRLDNRRRLKVEDKSPDAKPITHRDFAFFNPSSQMNQFTPLIYPFKNGYLLYDPRSHKSAVFFWKDHSRLFDMAKAFSQCRLYFSLYNYRNKPLNKEIRQKYDQLFRIYMDIFRTVGRHDANYVCRTFDVIQFIYYARLASDVTDRAERDQLEKFEKENLGRIVDYRKVLACVTGTRLGAVEVMELLKVYKVLPCPDFCSFSGISSSAGKYMRPNQFNVDRHWVVAEGLEYDTSLDEFKLYQARQMALMYHARHDILPGNLRRDMAEPPPAHLVDYPDVDPTRITVDDMRWIDFDSCFVWKSFDDLEHELVADKSMAPSRKPETIAEEKMFNNQVLNFLFNPRFEKQESCRDKIRSGTPTWDKHIRIAFKPESKKPGSRVFYICTDQDRRVLSEFEENVADYVSHKVGSSQRKGDMDLGDKMYNIATRNLDGHQSLKVSFDLAAFSPKMNPQLKKLGFEKWRKAFGQDHIPGLMRIFDDRTIYHEKFGHTDRFKLPGVDMEGLTGRMNTDLHIDIMGYCVYKMRGAGVFQESAQFECLIDDGLLEVQLENDGFVNRANAVMIMIEQIYSSFGLEISWDKTFVSRYVFQYLNEVFIEEHRATPGVKSFLRIGKRLEVPVANMRDELANIAGTVRGAIKSSSEINVAYWCYIIEIYFCVKHWTSFEALPEGRAAFACKTHLPFALGGLSINSVYSLVTNETFDSFETTVANCRLIALTAPNTARYFEKAFEVSPNLMTDRAILKAPRSLTFPVLALTNRKFQSAVKPNILARSVNPYIRILKGRIAEAAATPCETIIALNDHIHETVRELLLQMDPDTMAEKFIGKLQNSNTAAYILGKKKVTALVLAYRKQARAVIRSA